MHTYHPFCSVLYVQIWWFDTYHLHIILHTSWGYFYNTLWPMRASASLCWVTKTILTLHPNETGCAVCREGRLCRTGAEWWSHCMNWPTHVLLQLLPTLDFNVQTLSQLKCNANSTNSRQKLSPWHLNCRAGHLWLRETRLFYGNTICCIRLTINLIASLSFYYIHLVF